MSVATKVIVQGHVAELEEREGISKTTGEVWRRREIIVLGGGVVAAVGFRGEAVKDAPKVGDQVQMIVEVGVYRDDDTLDFVRYLSAPKSAG